MKKKKGSNKSKIQSISPLEATKSLGISAFKFWVLLCSSEKKLLKKKKNRIFKEFEFSKSSGYRAIEELTTSGFLKDSKTRLKLKKTLLIDGSNSLVLGDDFVDLEGKLLLLREKKKKERFKAKLPEIQEEQLQKYPSKDWECFSVVRIYPKNGNSRLHLDNNIQKKLEIKTKETEENQLVREKEGLKSPSPRNGNVASSVIYYNNTYKLNLKQDQKTDKTNKEQQENKTKVEVGKEKEKTNKREKETDKQQEVEVGNSSDEAFKEKIASIIDLDKMKKQRKKMNIKTKQEKKEINWNKLRTMNAEFQSLCLEGSELREACLNILATSKKNKDRKELVKMLGKAFAEIYTSYRIMVLQERGQKPTYVFSEKEYPKAETVAQLCLEKCLAPWILIQYWHEHIKNFKSQTRMNIPPLNILGGNIDTVVCSDFVENLKRKSPKEFGLRVDEKTGRAKDYVPAIKKYLNKKGFDVRNKTDREILSIQTLAEDLSDGIDLIISDPDLEKMAKLVSKKFF